VIANAPQLLSRRSSVNEPHALFSVDGACDDLGAIAPKAWLDRYVRPRIRSIASRASICSPIQYTANASFARVLSGQLLCALKQRQYHCPWCR
jgi:hypothetical protein